MGEIGEPHPGEGAFMAGAVPDITAVRRLVDATGLRRRRLRQHLVVHDRLAAGIGLMRRQHDDVRVPGRDLLGIHLGLHPETRADILAADQRNVEVLIALFAGRGELALGGAQVQDFRPGRVGMGRERRLDLADHRVTPFKQRLGLVLLAKDVGDEADILPRQLLRTAIAAADHQRNRNACIAQGGYKLVAPPAPLNDEVRLQCGDRLDIRHPAIAALRDDATLDGGGIREHLLEEAGLESLARDGIHADQMLRGAVHRDDGRGAGLRQRDDPLRRARKYDLRARDILEGDGIGKQRRRRKGEKEKGGRQAQFQSHRSPPLFMIIAVMFSYRGEGVVSSRTNRTMWKEISNSDTIGKAAAGQLSIASMPTTGERHWREIVSSIRTGPQIGRKAV